MKIQRSTIERKAIDFYKKVGEAVPMQLYTNTKHERALMITRIWEGRTKIEHSKVYSKIIEERDIPDYKKTAGFVKLAFLKRSDDGYTYFKLLTFWTDMEAVKNFTGPHLEEAKFYKEDEQYLIDFPGRVSHYEVFAE